MLMPSVFGWVCFASCSCGSRCHTPHCLTMPVVTALSLLCSFFDFNCVLVLVMFVLFAGKIFCCFVSFCCMDNVVLSEYEISKNSIIGSDWRWCCYWSVYQNAPENIFPCQCFSKMPVRASPNFFTKSPTPKFREQVVSISLKIDVLLSYL